MNYIFSGSIIGCVWQDGLDRLLLYWLTRRFQSPMSAHPSDHLNSDVFRPKFPSAFPLTAIFVRHLNPHRLQRDFLLFQAGYPPRNIRVSNSNGLLGNVSVVRWPPVNNQPIAGHCLIWRGSLSGSKDGNDGGYAQYGAKALHRIMYEESRRVSLATEDMVLHLCHGRSCIQPSHLYIGDDADNAEDRSRRFQQPYLPTVPGGDQSLEERLRAALLSDLNRLRAEFHRSDTEHSRAWDAANYAILEIPTLEPPTSPRFLIHECRPGPWAGSVHICQICNMTPGEIERLPLLSNLLAWDKAYPQQWWEFEESTKPVIAWLRRQGPGNNRTQR